MILLLIILILLILVYMVRVSNNEDIIKNNLKYETDKTNIKNAKKHFSKSKASLILTFASIIVLIVFIIMDFTSIDAQIIDYFSTDFYKEQEFERMYYFLPLYVIVGNAIYIQVRTGDFLLKYFKTQEEEFEIKINKEKIMGLLYKKKTTTDTTSEENKQEELPKEEPKVEKQTNTTPSKETTLTENTNEKSEN